MDHKYAKEPDPPLMEGTRVIDCPMSIVEEDGVMETTGLIFTVTVA